MIKLFSYKRKSVQSSTSLALFFSVWRPAPGVERTCRVQHFVSRISACPLLRWGRWFRRTQDRPIHRPSRLSRRLSSNRCATLFHLSPYPFISLISFTVSSSSAKYTSLLICINKFNSTFWRARSDRSFLKVAEICSDNSDSPTRRQPPSRFQCLIFFRLPLYTAA